MGLSVYLGALVPVLSHCGPDPKEPLISFQYLVVMLSRFIFCQLQPCRPPTSCELFHAVLAFISNFSEALALLKTLVRNESAVSAELKYLGWNPPRNMLSRTTVVMLLAEEEDKREDDNPQAY